MKNGMVVMMICYAVVMLAFLFDILVEFIRMKMKFRKEIKRLAIEKQIYINAEIAKQLIDSKRLTAYPVLNNYIGANFTMVKALEKGIAVEKFPVAKKNPKTMTSKQQKQVHHLVHEVLAARDKDPEVFVIATQTAKLLRSIYDYQHPVKLRFFQFQTEFFCFTLTSVIKILDALNRMSDQRKKDYDKKQRAADNIDMIALSYSN